jgi:hypothetical protein
MRAALNSLTGVNWGTRDFGAFGGRDMRDADFKVQRSKTTTGSKWGKQRKRRQKKTRLKMKNITKF